MTYIKLLLITLCLFVNVTLKSSNEDSLEVVKSANAFVTAFNNFDWQAFKTAFTNDATIFFPMWDKSKRVTGGSDIEAAWAILFPEFEDSNNHSRLQIVPKTFTYRFMEKRQFDLSSGQWSK